MNKLVRFSVNNPKVITVMMVIITIILALLAALPTLLPESFPRLKPAMIDTDPENMLPEDEPVRVFHQEMKKTFALWDMIVVGVVNNHHPEGVFNVATLQKIHALASYAEELTWADPDNPEHKSGVIAVDMLAPSTVDNIEPGAIGEVKFEWLMKSPPATPEEALAVRDKAKRIPMFNGTLVSDGDKDATGQTAAPKAIAIYIPLTDKHLSYKVASKLQERIADFGIGDEEFHITGLPVAEDTFGVEMFKQMALSAPLAMLIIFLLMWFFFRKFSLIISPMIVAVVCVIQTMGLLVTTGHTIHIMSSMIPIFIMPIAVLDAIHILSEFFDRYQESKDKRETILKVMDTLFTPMLYTSLTTAVGFASLALTPIPPVQVFGLFIAFGVMMAWLWTVTFIPASIMFIRQKSLDNFGLTEHNQEVESHSLLSRLLAATGRLTFQHAKLIMLLAVLVALAAIYGISKININDNPVKWFEPNHSIRIADKELNKHFAGTYMAYLTLASAAGDETVPATLASLEKAAEAKAKTLAEDGYEGVTAVFANLLTQAKKLAPEAVFRAQFLKLLETYAQEQAEAKTTPEVQIDAWYEAATFVSSEKQSIQTFKDPGVLNWIAGLQQHLLTLQSRDQRQLVGKSSSLADIVRTVYRELRGGSQEYYIIPDNRQGVAQTLMQYQNSHRPQDLWHFVEKPDETADQPGYRKISLWIQLKSGDNQDMQEVIDGVDAYIAGNPPTSPLTHNWFGLTYINVIWQDKMVQGMLGAFLGSFLVVFLIMMLLFRSALWGLLSMVPLLVTIGAIYGLIGFIGKDYDMPVAVLSSLSLGLAIDYAIHFLARSRELRATQGEWQATVGPMFGEPARAITRNVLVIGVGFLPLLACKCGTCIAMGVTAIILIGINIYQFMEAGITTLSLISIIGVVMLFLLCCLASRRSSCRQETHNR
ncbi:MAG: MMPL family transporter [Planctomycetes bacterium]|nr:MMPL family transporter [Planctomycetota bacterium]